MEEHDVLRVDDCARYLRVSERFLRQLIADGKLPFSRIGRRVLIRRSDADRFLRLNRVPAVRR